MFDDLLNKDDLSLFTSASRFQISTVFLRQKMEKDVATFDLFVREMPKERNYLVFAGLERVINYLRNLKLNPKQLAWLKKTGISKEGYDYFKTFRFTGDIHAMPEGTIFFPNEPIMRVTAPIIEAQFIEWCIINFIFLETILASKFSRFIGAARGKELAFGYNRSYGPDTAMRAVRLDQIFGIPTSLACYFYKHKLPPSFSAGSFHYLIMAFDKELESFRAYLNNLGGRGYVLVDTYDSEKGIKNFIKAAEEFEKKSGKKVTGIQLDSGDLLDLSRKARRSMDKAGLKHAKIFAMGNLNEKKISALEQAKAPIDVYAGTTEMMTPIDAPTIELVYKLSEIEKSGKIYPKMKLAVEKKSFPGKKQVFRINGQGKYAKDVVGLEGEKIVGEKLLVPIIKKGKLVRKLPTLEQIGDYYREEKTKFDQKMFSVTKKFDYKVEISKRLSRLANETKRNIVKVHHGDDLET